MPNMAVVGFIVAKWSIMNEYGFTFRHEVDLV